MANLNNNLKLAQLNKNIEKEFQQSIKFLPNTLIAKMKYLSQGKRVRTKLLFHCASIINFKIEELSLLAYSIELIHSISLLHDDVIDKDSNRRGSKTINKVFDNKTAILLGDFLIQNLFYTLINSPVKIKEILLKKLREICQGELMQNTYSKLKKEIHLKDILKIAKKKTGSLFSLSAILPCIKKKMGKKETKFFEDCGYAYGICYQLLDDYKDIINDYQKNKNLNSNSNFTIQLSKLENLNLSNNKNQKKKLKKLFNEIIKKINNIFNQIKKNDKKKEISKQGHLFFEYTKKEILLYSESIKVNL